MEVWTLLLLALCAVSAQCEVMPKIRGPGRTEVAPGEFPYFGFVRKRGTFELITSGILIKSNVFLTLGYNYYRSNIAVSDIDVVFGTHDRSTSEDSRQVINAEKLLIHPELIETWQGAQTGDLMLIKLAKAVTTNKRVKIFNPRNINDDPKLDNQLERSGNCVSMGYGYIRHNPFEKDLPRTLQKYGPQVRSYKTCREYAELKNQVWPKRKWMCSLNEDLTETRPYDGGNPLLCTTPGNTKPVLHGLVSGGSAGYASTGYTYFTQLSTYQTWIVNNAKALQKEE